MDLLTSFWTPLLLSVGISGVSACVVWAVHKGILYVRRCFAVFRSIKITLRDLIFTHYEKYVGDGFVTVDDLSHLEELFSYYTTLGGNGQVSVYMDKIRELPSSLPPNFDTQ